MNDHAHDQQDRIEELEGRLKQLEHALEERPRGLMGRIMPPDATNHFRAAGREQLLGMRSLVDHWIGRLEAAERKHPAPTEREEIHID
jgi:hypothetical protein